MTQEAHNSSIEVEIFDQTYSLCGPDPEYVLKLAEYVDSRMREIANETHTADSEQLAVLSAVRIAAEYHLLKAKLDGGVSDSSMSNHSSEWEELEEKTPEGEEKETSGAERGGGKPIHRRRPTAHLGEAPTAPHEALVRAAVAGGRRG